jgi:hypothetical protein
MEATDQMTYTSDFGKLYRAAFAERDPERKLALLSQLHRAIKPWEEEETALVKHEPQSTIPFSAKAVA